jgi:aryl-alcohol dehydrogenase-like predicted oxidoreductase
MEYRPLGDSGLNIATITLGAWSFGSNSWANQRSDEECARVVAAALDHGINILDTAHFYGRSQEIVGKALVALGSRRKEMLIATKGNGDRASIRQQCENSLRMLGVETIDLYYIHGPKVGLPVGEQIGYLAELRQEGKIRAIGVSNFRLSQHQEAYAAVPFQASQPCYGPLWHEIEDNGVGAWCREHNVAVMPFSPLAHGLLTGKFRTLEDVPQDRRQANLLLKPERFPLCLKVVDKVAEIGARYGKTIAQTSLAWCNQSPDVTSAIVGARSVEQVAENAGGAGWTMSAADWQEIHDLGRVVWATIPPMVNIWGDAVNWGT